MPKGHVSAFVLPRCGWLRGKPKASSDSCSGECGTKTTQANATQTTRTQAMPNQNHQTRANRQSVLLWYLSCIGGFKGKPQGTPPVFFAGALFTCFLDTMIFSFPRIGGLVGCGGGNPVCSLQEPEVQVRIQTTKVGVANISTPTCKQIPMSKAGGLSRKGRSTSR